MLIEKLFEQGVMKIGPSPRDPSRQVGVFPPDLITRIATTRASELAKFSWISGEWSYENAVPSTRLSPAYVDAGQQQFVIANSWVCTVVHGGRLEQQITFDPFSNQWIYSLARGSYALLRSANGWQGNQIVFTGPMLMIGIDCEWRMTWSKSSDDQFRFVNEEKTEDGTWAYVDEWRFDRVKPG